MGYTHYWTHKKRFTNDQWDTIRTDVNAIIVMSQADGVEFGDAFGEKPLDNLTQCWGTDSVLVFNGLADDAHETFVIQQNRCEQKYWQDKSQRGWAFCKTARKPYDAAVVACLAYLVSVYPTHFSASSDGNVSDWDDGLSLAKRALPRLDNILQVPAEMQFDAQFSQYHFFGGKMMVASLQDGTFCIVNTNEQAIVGRFKAGEATTWISNWLNNIAEERRKILPARDKYLDRWAAQKMRHLAEAAPVFGYMELT
jgi:hypothetical protein